MSKCGYSDTDLSAPDHSIGKVTIPESWECTRDSVDGENRCLFHLTSEERTEAGISKEEVVEVANDILTSSGRRSDLIGANIPELNVHDTVVTGDDGDILDLRFATIDGEIDFTDTRVELPLKAEGAEIGGGLELDNTVFESEVSFYGARIKGTVEGVSVHFRDKAIFARILASYSIRLKDSTVFEKTAIFSNLKIVGTSGKLELRRISAYAPFYCRDIEIPALDCSEAIFEGLVGMSNAHVKGEANFSGAHFQALAAFGDGDRKKFDDNTRIEGEANFSSVLADQTLSFEGVQFHGGIDLSNGTFYRGVELKLITLYDYLLLDNADFEDSLIFKPQLTKIDEKEYFLVEATEVTISAGELAQPGHANRDPVRYEFIDATIGDVTFLDTELDGEPYIQSNYSYYPAPLDNIRFIRTRFEGFDFTSYRTQLEGDWKIHQFRDPGANEDSNLSEADLELTYMYGKRGASDIGDNLAESRFFEHEMRYRTERYHPSNGNPHSGSWRKYAGLRLWGLTDFSESPFRVISLGVGFAGLFAGLYALFDFLNLTGTPYVDMPAIIRYPLFSAESLVTLVHPTEATIDSWLLRFLSAIEGFIGALVIALFVFSLTRAVHR